jgi:hypothetical protein
MDPRYVQNFYRMLVSSSVLEHHFQAIKMLEKCTEDDREENIAVLQSFMLKQFSPFRTTAAISLLVMGQPCQKTILMCLDNCEKRKIVLEALEKIADVSLFYFARDAIREIKDNPYLKESEQEMAELLEKRISAYEAENLERSKNSNA